MIGEVWAAFKRWWCSPLPKIGALDLSTEAIPYREDLPEGKAPKVEDLVFAVTSKPRHIPWSRRKKELEADARQKRRAREEFREQS